MDWFLYENQAKQNGFYYVCGVDEAGRGPLAGPVVAAAVILPDGCEIEGLNDSKKLSEKKREQLFPIIKECAVTFSVAQASEKEIDTLNILGATFLAMKRAINALDPKPDYALIDGNRLPKDMSIEAKAIVKGDSLSASIAAASILAKVTRDHLLQGLDKEYPEYGFAKHKGYPTKAHYEAIEKYGILDIHRRSFLKKLL